MKFVTVEPIYPCTTAEPIYRFEVIAADGTVRRRVDMSGVVPSGMTYTTVPLGDVQADDTVVLSCTLQPSDHVFGDTAQWMDKPRSMFDL